MTKTERLRRVVIVCGYFTRNLAYYRAAWQDKTLRGATHHFWRHVNSNFFDIAVLEWCKLLGDKKDPHHWSKVVSNPTTFEKNLLSHLGISASAFKNYIDGMRHYRDKFIAHLDSEPVMNIPNFKPGKAAVDFYHAHIVTKEIADLHELAGLVTKLDDCYREAMQEAKSVYNFNQL